MPLLQYAQMMNQKGLKQLPVVMGRKRGLTSTGPREEPMWLVAMVNNRSEDRS